MGFLNIAAQKNLVKAEFGYAHFLSKKANGISTGFSFQRQISEQSGLGFSIGYLFAEKRGLLPKDLTNQKVFLKDFTNSPTWPGFNPSYPEVQLSTKPDKYFDFNFGIHYLYTVWHRDKHSIRIGLGGVFTFHDEQEIVELIKGDYRVDAVSLEVRNALFPVFKYDTYLDLGLHTQIEYRFQLKERMSLGITNAYLVFPKTERFFLTVSTFMAFSF
jgi:hypothetical protein